MSTQAFVDESGRGSSYHVCVAVVANGDVHAVRRLARSFCLPGQRGGTLFTNERADDVRALVRSLRVDG
jgi:hypothetical protein